MHTTTIGNIKVWQLEEDGPQLGSLQSALDLIGESFGGEIGLVAVPVARLAPDFLRLGSGLAGAFIEKMQQYRLRVAIVGDISERAANSKPLHDFVLETNRRGQHLFVRDDAELVEKMQRL
jgi:hypothetical protein